MPQDLTTVLTDALEHLATEHGLELVAVEVAGRSHAPVVRVFLDREGGIDLDTLAASNGWISDAIEATGAVRGSYTLEVSSPGLERPLRKREDYERFAGRKASIRLLQPVDGRTTFTGILAGLEGGHCVIEVEGTAVKLPLDGIRKAHLVFDLASIDEGMTR